MNQELLKRLRCPVSGQELELVSASPSTTGAEQDHLISKDGGYRYEICGSIPRFVPKSNYADNFGMQWNHFSKTQLDSFSGHAISAERFWKATGWNSDALRGKWVLDVGCGSGRFAEIALSAGANVVAIDYSSAVDACYENLKQHPMLHVVQADIYALPFEPESFDYVYSLGVLQHTPDVRKSFACLPPMLKAGGQLCVDYYEKSWRSLLSLKYWLRPLTSRLPKQKLFSALEILVPILLPVSRLLGAVPLIGTALKRLIPVVNYYGSLPLDAKQQREWSLLDTFDWLAPAYDNPQTDSTARLWMEDASLNNIEVLQAGHLVARGAKRST